MRLRPTTSGPRAAKARLLGGFTLAEVLAALVFMSIVIPVAVQAVRVASQAGQVGERKAAAARIAERVLNELLVTGALQQSTRNGTVEEGDRVYQWTMRSEPWSEGAMNLVTVQVVYSVQGRDHDVNVSTLYNPATQITTTTTTQ